MQEFSPVDRHRTVPIHPAINMQQKTSSNKLSLQQTVCYNVSSVIKHF